jgi:hypothetical protein
MDRSAALAEIEALSAALDEACDRLMTEAETGLALASQPTPDVARLSAVFAEVLSLCSFQDLAGQRLSRLANAIAGSTVDTRPDAHLLNGPADSGGLDQSAADALFDER